MKIVGLIAEYNPFHNGHLHHLTEAKKISGADAVIAVMSGDFVQRGAPAMLPKRLRAKMAVLCGADLVLELPVCFSTGSAEYFAAGAVSLLDSLGIVDSVCFGSECGDLEILSRAADLLAEEPEQYRNALREYLRLGESFPSAREKAFLSCTGDVRAAAVLQSPNNILAVEYLKALKRLGSPITPYTIPRRGAGYHDTAVSGKFSSAAAIRKLFSSAATPAENAMNDDITVTLAGQMPSPCSSILSENRNLCLPVFQDDFSLLLKQCLLREDWESLTAYADVSEELARRICRQSDSFLSFSQFSSLLKTKETTQTRIDRALLHILLGIKKEDMEEYKKNGYALYARPLAVNEDSTRLLSMMDRKSRVPIVTKLSDREMLSPAGQRMLDCDIYASNLYGAVVTDKFRTPFSNELRQGLLKFRT